jgi:hypothetical protein
MRKAGAKPQHNLQAGRGGEGVLSIQVGTQGSGHTSAASASEVIVDGATMSMAKRPARPKDGRTAPFTHYGGAPPSGDGAGGASVPRFARMHANDWRCRERLATGDDSSAPMRVSPPRVLQRRRGARLRSPKSIRWSLQGKSIRPGRVRVSAGVWSARDLHQQRPGKRQRGSAALNSYAWRQHCQGLFQTPMAA